MFETTTFGSAKIWGQIILEVAHVIVIIQNFSWEVNKCQKSLNPSYPVSLSLDRVCGNLGKKGITFKKMHETKTSVIKSRAVLKINWNKHTTVYCGPTFSIRFPPVPPKKTGDVCVFSPSLIISHKSSDIRALNTRDTLFSSAASSGTNHPNPAEGECYHSVQGSWFYIGLPQKKGPIEFYGSNEQNYVNICIYIYIFEKFSENDHRFICIKLWSLQKWVTFKDPWMMIVFVGCNVSKFHRCPYIWRWWWLKWTETWQTFIQKKVTCCGV